MMSNLIEKAGVFFEFIVIGVAFGVVGYHFMLSYNTSFIGILGIMAMLFGLYNVLIGVYIFGAYFFALLFKPEWLQNDLPPTTLSLAEEHIAANETLTEQAWEEEEELEEVQQISFFGQLWRESILIETVVLALLIILC
jgi:hypothetical protein